MAVIGYGRMSGDETSPDPQIHALQDAGAVEVFVDLGRLGRTQARPQLDECLGRLHPGDTLIVTGLVRLSRSIEHVVDLISQLHRHGIGLRSLAEGLDTVNTPDLGEFATMLSDVGAGIVRENTLEGLARAERSGHRPGRPPAMTAEQIAEAWQLRNQGMSWRSIGAKLGVSHSTVHRVVTSTRSFQSSKDASGGPAQNMEHSRSGQSREPVGRTGGGAQ